MPRLGLPAMTPPLQKFWKQLQRRTRTCAPPAKALSAEWKHCMPHHQNRNQTPQQHNAQQKKDSQSQPINTHTHIHHKITQHLTTHTYQYPTSSIQRKKHQPSRQYDPQLLRFLTRIQHHPQAASLFSLLIANVFPPIFRSGNFLYSLVIRPNHRLHESRPTENISTSLENRANIRPANPEHRSNRGGGDAIALLDAGSQRGGRKIERRMVTQQWLKKAVLAVLPPRNTPDPLHAGKVNHPPSASAVLRRCHTIRELHRWRFKSAVPRGTGPRRRAAAPFIAKGSVADSLVRDIGAYVANAPWSTLGHVGSCAQIGKKASLGRFGKRPAFWNRCSQSPTIIETAALCRCPFGVV